MRIMNSERRISQILDIELMPTTGGEVLVCYQIIEDGVQFSFTHGLYGRVFDFEDGTSIEGLGTSGIIPNGEIPADSSLKKLLDRIEEDGTEEEEENEEEEDEDDDFADEDEKDEE